MRSKCITVTCFCKKGFKRASYTSGKSVILCLRSLRLVRQLKLKMETISAKGKTTCTVTEETSGIPVVSAPLSYLRRKTLLQGAGPVDDRHGKSRHVYKWEESQLCYYTKQICGSDQHCCAETVPLPQTHTEEAAWMKQLYIGQAKAVTTYC